MKLDDLKGRLTLTVPEAANLCGLGRDTAYAAAERGDLPARRVGRRWVVPTHALLEEVLGMPPQLIARVLGLAPESREPGSEEEPGSAVHSLPPQHTGRPSYETTNLTA